MPGRNIGDEKSSVLARNGGGANHAPPILERQKHNFRVCHGSRFLAHHDCARNTAELILRRTRKQANNRNKKQEGMEAMDQSTLHAFRASSMPQHSFLLFPRFLRRTEFQRDVVFDNRHRSLNRRLPDQLQRHSAMPVSPLQRLGLLLQVSHPPTSILRKQKRPDR